MTDARRAFAACLSGTRAKPRIYRLLDLLGRIASGGCVVLKAGLTAAGSLGHANSSQPMPWQAGREPGTGRPELDPICVPGPAPVVQSSTAYTRQSGVREPHFSSYAMWVPGP
jgi:hypothetical protein